MEDKVIRFSAPPVPQAVPLLRVAENASFRDAGGTAIFMPWRSPEQLRTVIATGAVDVVIAALPTAAVLSNKGIDCKILAVYSAPLWIVSAGVAADEVQEKSLVEQFTTLSGKEILLPFGPGNMPELALESLAAELNIKLTVRYCGSAMEAGNFLRRGQATYALLPEPAAMRVETQGSLHIKKLFPLKDVWPQVFAEHPHMPTAALLMVGPLSNEPDACALIRKVYVENATWAEGNTEAALRLAEEKYPELGKTLVSSLDYDKGIFHSLGLLTGVEGEKAARFLFERLYAVNPASIGGRLPDENIWGFRNATP